MRTPRASEQAYSICRTTAILAVTKHGRDAPATAGRTPALRLKGCGFHSYVAPSPWQLKVGCEFRVDFLDQAIYS